MRKRIIILLLSMILCVGMIIYTRQNAYQKFYYEQYEKAARTLRSEQDKLKQELQEVEQNLKEVDIGQGCYLLLFEDLDQRLYTDAMPILRKHDYVGVLALSPQSYPGKEGCITLDEFNELISMGWETCFYWQDYFKFDYFLEKMDPILKNLKLEYPTVIDVEAGNFQPYKDEMLSDAGFATVIHHGETGDIITREDSEELLHVGAVGWNSSYAVKNLKNAIQYGGALVLSIDFSDNSSVGFQKKAFAAMCDNLQEQHTQIYSTNIQGLRDNLAAAPTNNYYSARKSYLETEIERYDHEIEAIYQLDLEDLSF